MSATFTKRITTALAQYSTATRLYALTVGDKFQTCKPDLRFGEASGIDFLLDETACFTPFYVAQST